ncbi:hypothetical protein [Aliiroseovarius sp. 2305UL8-7]|uniref:hypothetical protein n=1 Tax=Aliiroseovarius conchicola TaxID=3121637 RepID=UPI003526E9B5
MSIFSRLKTLFRYGSLSCSKLPAGNYAFFHRVDRQSPQVNFLFGEVKIPDADLATQIGVLVQTTLSGQDSTVNAGAPIGEAETFLSPLNVGGSEYRKEMRALTFPAAEAASFSLSPWSSEWTYRDTHHFESWLITLDTCDAAIATGRKWVTDKTN